jgi:mannose-6-phosphate isomerase-like protein (cupin superfamily)
MKLNFQTTVKKALEALAVLGLVLLAFLGILQTLNTVFPTGQNLFDLLRPGEKSQDLTAGEEGSRELKLVTASGGQGQREGAEYTAILSRMENSVKSAKGMRLYNRDAIQTLHKSAARLSFKGENFLDLDENSLLILRKLDRDVFIRENRTVVVLVGGQLTGGVTDNVRESFNLEVVSPGAVARFPSLDNKGQPARFKMSVNQDESSVLTVLEGTADLVLEGGSMEVSENQVVKVKPGEDPVYLSTPPGPPVLTSPADGKTLYYRDVSPTVSFSWVGAGNFSQFLFVLSNDPQFNDIVHEDTIRGTRFSHGNLKAGDYYWRVSPVSNDWDHAFSSTRHFTLIQDLVPPVLEVEYPDSPITSEVMEVKGVTEPEARVFVRGIPVTVDAHGQFTQDLFLQHGSNVIVVEAVDKVGNVTYFSRIINAEF